MEPGARVPGPGHEDTQHSTGAEPQPPSGCSFGVAALCSGQCRMPDIDLREHISVLGSSVGKIKHGVSFTGPPAWPPLLGEPPRYSVSTLPTLLRRLR